MTVNAIQLDSIQVLQSEVVPSESKQFNLIHIYTTSEIEPFQIDSKLHASYLGCFTYPPPKKQWVIKYR